MRERERGKQGGSERDQRGDGGGRGVGYQTRG